MSAPEQFPAMVAGFGAGKSHAAIMRAIAKKLCYPKQNVAYYLPTYRLVADMAFPRFAEALSELSIPFTINKTDADVIIGPGGAWGKIILRTMDTPERIVAYEVADSIVDELDTLPKDKAADVWRRVMSRNRQKKPDGSPNTIGVATTPEGFRFVHWRWVEQAQPGYRIIQAPTYSNKHLPADYVDNIRNDYPPQLIDAYIEGRFVNLTSGSVYSSFDRTRCNSDETIREYEPLFIGQDFNVGAMSSAVIVRRPDGWHAVDEVVGILDTPALISTLASRYGGHKLYLYPDASGGSRKTVNASVSDIALLQKAGISVRAPAKNPPVKDRILALNGAFERAELRVNAKRCPTIAAGLEQQAFDKNGEPDKSSGYDHMNDALGYFVHYEMPIRKPIAAVPVRFTY
ncbi:terminase large subunit domain-containing protein [Aureimonas fodinaquatilis]|uniref:terminase large subunit domain-containing protein n=1 Tax=Aureimonas fodinaquatilis TaxID=2565783 RepID=UPI001AEEE83A|nr:terminase family protein [Aureimonas fodinaquatilis]